MSKTTELSAVLAEAAALGLTATVETNKHHKIRLVAADGRTAVFVTGKTASDWRGIKNAVARVRRFADGRDV